MIFRNIQLKNNFYVIPEKTQIPKGDEEIQMPKGDEETPIPKGDFTAFGYFDAIIPNKQIELNPDAGSRQIWRQVSKSIIDKLDGTTTIRNILCFYDLEKKTESDFWVESEKHPFLMLSMIRIEPSEKLISLVTDDSGLILYYTSVHSDLVALAWGDNYSECRSKILSLKPRFAMLKAFSIISINDKKLDVINDENLGCRFRIAVKNPEEFKEKFIKEMKKKLTSDIHLWYMLGSNDYLIEAQGVSIKELVKCYVGDGIMVHENYKKLAYNIETEILLESSQTQVKEN